MNVFLVQQRKTVLCEAINKLLVVRLKYDDDLYWRTFEPQAVYKSTADNILVTGIQTRNQNEPLKPPERKLRNFELELIKVVEVTEVHFEFDPAFKSTDKRFANGFICIFKPSKIR